jgi:hypothetical protein
MILYIIYCVGLLDLLYSIYNLLIYNALISGFGTLLSEKEKLTMQVFTIKNIS